MTNVTNSQGNMDKVSVAYWATLPCRALAGLPDDQVKFLITATRIANDVLLLQRLLIAIVTGSAKLTRAAT